jgi:acylphosphatase
VECLAEGSRDRLEVLLEALREGPPGAWVDDVDVRWRPPAGRHVGFAVRASAHPGD